MLCYTRTHSTTAESARLGQCPVGANPSARRNTVSGVQMAPLADRILVKAAEEETVRFSWLQFSWLPEQLVS